MTFRKTQVEEEGGERRREEREGESSRDMESQKGGSVELVTRVKRVQGGAEGGAKMFSTCILVFFVNWRGTETFCPTRSPVNVPTPYYRVTAYILIFLDLPVLRTRVSLCLQ